MNETSFMLVGLSSTTRMRSPAIVDLAPCVHLFAGVTRRWAANIVARPQAVCKSSSDRQRPAATECIAHDMGRRYHRPMKTIGRAACGRAACVAGVLVSLV